MRQNRQGRSLQKHIFYARCFSTTMHAIVFSFIALALTARGVAPTPYNCDPNDPTVVECFRTGTCTYDFYQCRVICYNGACNSATFTESYVECNGYSCFYAKFYESTAVCNDSACHYTDFYRSTVECSSTARLATFSDSGVECIGPSSCDLIDLTRSCCDGISCPSSAPNCMAKQEFCSTVYFGQTYKEWGNPVCRDVVLDTVAPTDSPSQAPTRKPTPAPTSNPTQDPTREPTPVPTKKPTVSPTGGPTNGPTPQPVTSSHAPTEEISTPVPTSKIILSTPAPTPTPTLVPSPPVQSTKTSAAPSTSETSPQPTEEQETTENPSSLPPISTPSSTVSHVPSEAPSSEPPTFTSSSYPSTKMPTQLTSSTQVKSGGPNTVGISVGVLVPFSVLTAVVCLLAWKKCRPCGKQGSSSDADPVDSGVEVVPPNDIEQPEQGPNGENQGIEPTEEQVLMHNAAPSSKLSEKALSHFRDRVPFDLFLIHTGAQKPVEVATMKAFFASAGFTCFLDSEMRPSVGSPTDMMKFALETCRHAVVVISRDFLEKPDPCAELKYAFERMEWLRTNYPGWESLWVVMFRISLSEYQDESAHLTHLNLPDIGHDVVLLEWSDEKDKPWPDFCRELSDQMVEHDENIASEQWNKFLEEWDSPKEIPFPRADGLYPRRDTNGATS